MKINLFPTVWPVWRWMLLVGIIALSAIATPAWRLFHSTATPPASAATEVASGSFKPSKAQWANLKVAEVRRMPFRTMIATDGVISYNEDALTPVFSPYSGRVVKVIAKPGDVVSKDAPLLVVEATEYIQAVSDLIAAQASLETARATERRQRELFRMGAAAEKDLRQAQADLANAESSWSVARGRLRIFGKSDSDIDQLSTHRPATGEAVITAPIAGTITQRQVGLGQYIVSAMAGAANPVLTIGDLSTVWLVANVRESDAPRVKIGQPAEVTTLALPGELFSGKVAWVGPSLDPVTHRLPVRIAVKNPDGLLKPQMFASFGIAISGITNAPAVPESALMYDGDIRRVFKVSGGDTLVAQSVRVGRSADGMVEILEGINAGDHVVISGTLFIDRAAMPD